MKELKLKGATNEVEIIFTNEIMFKILIESKKDYSDIQKILENNNNGLKFFFYVKSFKIFILICFLLP